MVSWAEMVIQLLHPHSLLVSNKGECLIDVVDYNYLLTLDIVLDPVATIW